MTACPGDTASTTDTATTDTATTDPSTSGPTTTAPESTSTTTGDVPTTTETSDTTTDTTSETTGGARVVYSTVNEDGLGFHELYFVDCTGATPGPAIRIHAPLAEGWSVASGAVFSPSTRWLHYELVHETLGQEVWVVDMSGPLPGAPVRVEFPRELAKEVAALAYSHDETRLALLAEQPLGGHQLYLCTLAPDGGCVPESWGLPLAAGGSVGGLHFAFSLDDTRIAYGADPEGDGTNQLYLAGTAPGDAGTAIAVSGADEAPLDSVWFGASNETLYYAYGVKLSELDGVRAVDLMVMPPAAPKVVTPGPGRYRFRADDSAVLWWDGAAFHGDLGLFGLDGTEPGPTSPVNDVPGRVSPKGFEWSRDDRFAVYFADTADTPEAWELFVVDATGPTPSPPTKVSAAIATDGEVIRAGFGPDPSFLVYAARPGGPAGVDLWLAPIDPPGEPVMLSAPLPAMGSLVGDWTFAVGGTRLLYSGGQESADAVELFMVDTAAPGVPIKVSAPLTVDEKVAIGAEFSADGNRVFYKAQTSTPNKIAGRVLQVDVAAPGEALPVSEPAHAVGLVRVLPPVTGEFGGRRHHVEESRRSIRRPRLPVDDEQSRRSKAANADG